MAMQIAHLSLTLALAGLALAGRWALARGRWSGGVGAGALAFLAALFLLKALPLLGRPTGLLRGDFLFPLWALWRPADAWWWLVLAALPLAGLAAAVQGAPRRVPAPLFLAATAALSASFWIALSLTNGGFPEGLVWPFLRDADYYADVARFDSLSGIWSGYTARQEGLSLHGQTHPPGAVTVLWALDRLAGGRLTWVCLGVVFLSTLTLLPLWAWARLHLPEPQARRAVVLWSVTPAVALYGATCMDMVFAVPMVMAAWLFQRRLVEQAREVAASGAPPAGPWRDVTAGTLSGLCLGMGLLFTFAGGVLALALAIQAAGRALAVRRAGPLVLLATAGGASILVLALSRLAGFDWLACLAAAMGLDAAVAPSFLSVRYYLLTRLMGALDFLVMSGVALAPLWLGALGQETLASRAGVATASPGESPARAGDGILLGASRSALAAASLFLLAGAFKIGETGRIGLFLLPFVLLPACRRLERTERPGRGSLVLAAWAAAQALLMEAFLDTRW